MKPRVEELWLEALRSGRYRQGFGTMRRGDEYCFLGVLCDLHAQETGNGWRYDEEDDVYTYLGAAAALPAEVIAWAGLPDHNPDLGGRPLANLNDLGYPFAELADMVATACWD
jgi:hypothetical protein